MHPTPRQSIAIMKIKLEWYGYPIVKESLKIFFTRFDIIHERDGRTERQTDRRTDGHRATA